MNVYITYIERENSPKRKAVTQKPQKVRTVTCTEPEKKESGCMYIYSISKRKDAIQNPRKES